MPPLSLVTGACGFMGSHMVEVLRAAGHRVRATDRPQAARPQAANNLKQVEFIPADLTNRDALGPAVTGVDYVFHIGAIFNYSAPWEILERVNVGGTENLCALLAGEKSFKRLVLWGAGGIFKPAAGPEAPPITEESPRDPANVYLRSKDLQEKTVWRYHRTAALPFTTIYGTGVYGPRGVYGTGQVLRDFARKKTLMVPRNFTFSFPLGHVRDLCEAALYLAQHPETNGESYLIEDDSRMNVLQVMACVAAARGHRFRTLPPIPLPLFRALLKTAAAGQRLLARWTHRPPSLEADTINYLGKEFRYANDKLKKTGYVLRYPDARVGLVETLNWYEQEGWL